jgi:hypothetical protein
MSKWWKYRGKQTCDICDGTEGKVLRVDNFDLVWSFHPECLKNIICNPEKHPKWVNYAYRVTKEMERQAAIEKKEIEALKRLQSYYECSNKPQPPPDRLIREGEQPEKR